MKSSQNKQIETLMTAHIYLNLNGKVNYCLWFSPSSNFWWKYKKYIIVFFSASAYAPELHVGFSIILRKMPLLGGEKELRYVVRSEHNPRHTNVTCGINREPFWREEFKSRRFFPRTHRLRLPGKEQTPARTIVTIKYNGQAFRVRDSQHSSWNPGVK